MKSHAILMGLILGAAGCGGTGDGPDGTVVEEKFFNQATDGGRGGSGGSVYVLYGESQVDPDENLRSAFELVGGAGGPGGDAQAGRPGTDGEAGPRGELEFVEDSGFRFDHTGIDPDMVVDIGSSNTIYLRDNLDPLPPMILDVLRIRSGAEMEIGCDVRIVARMFVIEPEGRLTVREREGMNCSIGIGRSLDRVPGLGGPLVYIQAQQFRLEGTLDISGNPGAPGQAGGDGGRLVLRTEQLDIGSQARVQVTGGAGGSGLDETPIPQD